MTVGLTDREWFKTHPHRLYRLRPTTREDLMPGAATAPPGWMTVVVDCGSPGRMRLAVGRPPAHLRRDTDRTCVELIERLDASGVTLNGQPVGQALAGARAALARLDAEESSS